MAKTISFTLENSLYRRLEEFRRSTGGGERSGIIQRALYFFLESRGPDPKVLKRWGPLYAKLREKEAALVDDWGKVQAESVGEP